MKGLRGSAIVDQGAWATERIGYKPEFTTSHKHPHHEPRRPRGNPRRKERPLQDGRQRVLDTLIETIQTAVKKGDAVQLVGFGTFKSVKRAARTGKNPSTGAAIKIPASTVPKFVSGAKFKAVVDPKVAKRKAEKAGR